MKFDPIRASVWRSNVHTALGLTLVTSCAIWAMVVIFETAWQLNPVATVFAAAMTYDIPEEYR